MGKDQDRLNQKNGDQEVAGTSASSAQSLFEEGLSKHQEGHLQEAEDLYREALEADPGNPDGLNLLAIIADAAGRNDEAIELMETATANAPENPEFLNNLGQLYKKSDRLDEAIKVYRVAITVEPKYVDALDNLGNALSIIGRLDEAIGHYRNALEIDPNNARTLYNLATALLNKGDFTAAIEAFRNIITLNPNFTEAHNNLGYALKELGQLDEAVASFQKALAIKPDYAEAHNNLGNVLLELNKPDDAVTNFHKALAVNADFAEAHNNLGNALRVLGKHDEAVASYRKALAAKLDYAEAHNNLGGALVEVGEIDEGVASYRKALSIKPDYAEAHSNLLLSEQYRLGHNAESLFKLHSEWDEQHGLEFWSDWPAHENVPDAERKLRIGFISPDLGRHPVGYFIIFLLENLPGHEIETVCYSDRIDDDLTERIKAAAGSWRYTLGVSDEDLSLMVARDGIDILFDLAGHTANNRLSVFARKPAPLQVTWAGYVGTTGLSAIDYLVSDKYSTREEDASFYSEKIIKMPDGWVSYDPPDYAPEVGPLPCKRNGSVTFCSFSNPSKINKDVVSVWARILVEVENARLLFRYRGIDSIANTNRLSAMFEAEGVDRSRLMLEERSPHDELLERYNDVDIALDPFPFSGGLTTCEALWMGVPVITAPGKTFASRHSLSLLSVTGLTELVARDHDDYVALAVGLAADTGRMESLRGELRERMLSSPICNGGKYAEAFAMQMREIWRSWCASARRT